jgi:hypothetical protein
MASRKEIAWPGLIGSKTGPSIFEGMPSTRRPKAIRASGGTGQRATPDRLMRPLTLPRRESARIHEEMPRLMLSDDVQALAQAEPHTAKEGIRKPHARQIDVHVSAEKFPHLVVTREELAGLELRGVGRGRIFGV